MSWIKNKINQLFKLEQEEYDDYDDYPNTQKSEQQQHNRTNNDFAQETEQPKKAFRFPLIEDDEEKPAKHEQPKSQTTRFYDDDKEKLSLPHYLQKQTAPEVYEVEVSGIRELLERRRKGTGHSNVMHTGETQRRMPILREEREALKALRAKSAIEPIKESKPVPMPLESRKRFIPSDVPSPVYGFKKPTPIEEHHDMEEQLITELQQASLHKKLQIEPEAHAIEPAVQIIEPEQKAVLERQIVEEILPIAHPEDEPANEQLVLPATVLETVKDTEAEAASSVAETINDVQVKHVTIENSTIHIGQLSVEQLPSADEEVIEKTEEELNPVQSVSTGSRVPFNVVMLKSDKEKLQTKKFVEQQLRLQKKQQEEQEGQHEIIDMPSQTIELQQSERHEQPDELLEIAATTGLMEMPEVEEVKEIEGAAEAEETRAVLEKQKLLEIQEVQEIQLPAKVPEVQEQKQLPEIQLEQDVSVEQEAADQPEQPIAQEKSVVVLEQPKVKKIPYVKPPLEYLVPPEEKVEDRDWMDEQGDNLVEALSHFQIQAQIESIVQGPAVTQFEITVGHGTKVSKVRNLTDDIKLALAAKDIRIDAPIPGKRSIGIEIPNRISRSVRLSEVTDSTSFKDSESPLEAALGLDLTGKPVTIDLRKMPHGLIAGATGSGKSVCINSILVSLLYKANPNELKLMLIDPKMVELAPFNHIPHLVSPVITDVKAATAALKWAVEEMERRYELFMHSGARKIEAYNKMCDENGMYAQKLPYLLIVIDELADLMMMSPQDVEDSIVRITQKARAAGIHLIVATQRPSVDVITGLIKSNIPTRIAFSVSSQIDSRTILDAQGAERLLGRGDMLYLGNGMSAPIRIQGTFVTDDEIEEIIEYVREQGEPQYIFKQEELLKRSEAVEEQDELFEEVCRFVYEQGSASTSLLQRRYHIGYNRAARLIDMLERHGYVSEPKGSKPRDVFITEDELFEQFGG